MDVLALSTVYRDETWDSVNKFCRRISLEESTSSDLSNGSNLLAESLRESTSTLSFGNPKDYISDVQNHETPLVAVVGVGYVGLHLIRAFSKHYKVIAFDISAKRIAQVADELEDNVDIHFTSDESHLVSATHFLVAVPTPLLPGTTDIDTSIIRNALATICSQARRGATIVIESSVSVGMTRSLLGKLAEAHELQAGMSPERVDPGRSDPPFEIIPKIISGLDDIAPNSLQQIHKLYSRVFTDLVPVSSPEVAEMTKLYENCQRMVCIAYANEMANACHKLPTPIDPYEVCRAAATKPFGYLAVTPSAGVGGHCIPVNPSYLFSTSLFPLLRHATVTMSRRPAEVADQVMKLLLPKGRYSTVHHRKHKPKVLVVGVAFKAGQELITNSPGVAIINYLLDSWDAHVCFADPLVREQALPYVPRLDEKIEWNKESLGKFNAIIVVMKQVHLNFTVLKMLPNVLVKEYCK